MKTLLLSLSLALFCSAGAQNLQRYRFHTASTPACGNEIFGLAGAFDDAGHMIALTGTGFPQGNYLDLLYAKTDSLQTGHYSALGSPVPHSVLRRGTYTYAAVLAVQGEYSNYYLLKFDDAHHLLAVKKVGEIITDVIQTAGVQLFPIPGSPEMLLCYHTVTPGDLISDIHLYSVDANLEATATIRKKIRFTEAHNQNPPFNASGNCSFFLSDSVLHYALLMNNYFIDRLETGRIHLGTDSVFSRWSRPVTGTSISQPNRVIEVRNDSVYHLVNSALAVYPDGDTVASYYRFDMPTMACRGLARTQSGDWVGIFSDYQTLNALCRFRRGSDVTFHHYGSLSPALILAKDDTLAVWGKYKNCAFGYDEFRLSDIASCHPFRENKPLLTVSVPIKPSSVVLSPAVPDFGTITPFAPKNLYCTTDSLCNPDMGIAETAPVGVRVYPNPTDGLLLLVSENDPITDVVLKTLTGATVTQKRAPASEQLTQDLSGLPAGVYVMEIRTASGLRTEKILKR